MGDDGGTDLALLADEELLRESQVEGWFDLCRHYYDRLEQVEDPGVEGDRKVCCR